MYLANPFVKCIWRACECIGGYHIKRRLFIQGEFTYTVSMQCMFSCLEITHEASCHRKKRNLVWCLLFSYIHRKINNWMDYHDFLTAYPFLNDAPSLMIDVQCLWEGINRKYNCFIFLCIHKYCILPEMHCFSITAFKYFYTIVSILNHFKKIIWAK